MNVTSRLKLDVKFFVLVLVPIGLFLIYNTIPIHPIKLMGVALGTIIFVLIYFFSINKSVTFMNELVEKLNNVYHKIPFVIPLLITTCCTFLYFLERNLFNDKIITVVDYPMHYYRVWYLINYLIPQFKHILGWSPYFFAGYPAMYLFPPGAFIFLAILTIMGLSIALSIRIIIVLTFFSIPLSSYYLCKELKYGENVSVLVSSFIVVFSYPWLYYLDWGLFSFILGLALTLLLFVILLSFSNNPDDYLLNTKTVFSAILFGFIILIHFIAGIIAAMGLLEYLAFYIFLMMKTKNKKNIRRIFSFISLTFIFGVLIAGFWVFPVSLVYRDYSGPSGPHLKPISFFEILMSIYVGIKDQYILLFVFIMGIIISLKRNNPERKFILFYFLSILLLIYPGGLISFVRILQPLRFMALLHVLLIIIGGSYFEEILRLFNKYQLRVREKILIGTTVLILVITLFSGIRIYYLQPDPYLSGPYENDYTYVHPDRDQLYAWMEDNTDNSSRIMLEMSIDNRNPNYAPLAPVFVNRYYIGGFFPYWHYKYGNIAMSREGEAFGVKFEDMNTSYFEKNLRLYNIRYIVVISDDANKFLEHYHQFKYIISIGRFSVYNYTNALDSYVWTNSSTASVTLIRFEANEINVRISNASKGDYVRISSYKFPNWHGYLNSEPQPLVESDQMLAMIIPEDGTFNLEFKFEQSLVEILSKWTSISMALLLLGIIVYNHRNRLKSTKFFKIRKNQ